MPFKFPLDAYVLAIPVAYSCCALTGLVYKTLTKDPELSRTGLEYYQADEVKEIGKQYNDSVKELFHTRISRNAFGVFNNR